MLSRRFNPIAFLLAMAFGFAWVIALEAAEGPPGHSAELGSILLATTTSTQDSGLLDELLPAFQKETGHFVKTIAVGSGQAIAMARRGEADVLLVHSPEDEARLLDEGNAVDRRRVMHNEFVVAGPPGDPARIRGAETAVEAFRKIAAARTLFLSRGDHSGTHAREMKIWEASGVLPEGQRWYQQTGLGMGDTLNVASEKGGYTLTDRGTFLVLRRNRGLSLEILVQGEPGLLNVYHVLTVSPAKWPRVNLRGAKALAEFLVSDQAQDIIRNFGKVPFGAPLFFPDAGKDAVQ